MNQFSNVDETGWALDPPAEVHCSDEAGESVLKLSRIILVDTRPGGSTGIPPLGIPEHFNLSLVVIV